MTPHTLGWVGAGGRMGFAMAKRLLQAGHDLRVYNRTRRFYRVAGYAQVAKLRDFYAPGDHKLMFCKVIRRRR